jgi:hypothetical protein
MWPPDKRAPLGSDTGRWECAGAALRCWAVRGPERESGRK